MNVESAVQLINQLVYKPGWKISATDHTNRFEGAVQVRIDYPAHASEREEAPNYAREIQTYAEFPMIVVDCNDASLYRRVINAIVEIETHEAREFLRVVPTMWAPFHPHRIDGMRRWGDESGDLRFGLA